MYPENLTDEEMMEREEFDRFDAAFDHDESPAVKERLADLNDEDDHE